MFKLVRLRYDATVGQVRLRYDATAGQVRLRYDATAGQVRLRYDATAGQVGPGGIATLRVVTRRVKPRLYIFCILINCFYRTAGNWTPSSPTPRVCATITLQSENFGGQ